MEFGFIKRCTKGLKFRINFSTCIKNQRNEDENLAPIHPNPSGVINIGVSRSDFSNVVENSYTSPDWFSEEPKVIVGTDDLSSIFYISTLSGKEQPFLAPHVTVYPPTAFQVTLSGPVRDGGIASGYPQRFVVNYICEKVSEGRVVVTIQLPGFTTIEYGYTKKCSMF